MNTLKSIFLSLALLGSNALAADDTWGPEPGTELPQPFEVLNADSRSLTLADISGEKGATLAFVRSLDWCPFCMRQAGELDQNARAFADTGYPVVTISYDSPAQLARFAERQAIEIPLLSDTDSRLIKALGILNDHYQPGDRGYGIPNPGIIVVSRDGEVLATFAEPNYKQRPRPAMVIAAIEGLEKEAAESEG